MIQAAAGMIAAVVTLMFTVAGRWIGGAWTTLLAILLCVLLAFHPLIHAELFGNLTTDRMQRSLFALIPFAVLLAGLSLKRVPISVHTLAALIGPVLVLTWAYFGYGMQKGMSPEVLHQHRVMLYGQRIVPVSLCVFVLWMLIEPIAVRSAGLAAPMVIALLAIACTFLLMFSAENNAGLMATPVAGSAGGAAMATLVAALIGKKSMSLARGPVLLWLAILGSLFGYLWINTDQLPLKYLSWLATVPLLAWIPEIGPIHRLKVWKRESIRLLLIAIPVVLTMTMAFKEHQREAAAAGDPFGMLLPDSHPAAPMLPSQMPMPNTINPPTIT